jgi:Fe-S cluster assembly protein SufD
MTETLPTTGALDAALLRASQGDPAWLQKARAAAAQRWAAAPVPDRVEHLWRYTDPARLLPGARAVLVPDARFGDVPDDFHDAVFDNAAAYAVARDGVLLRSAVDPPLADLGVVVEDLRTAAKARKALVEPCLFALRRICDAAGAKFDDLSAAVFVGGAFVRVPRGVDLDRPVRIASRVGGDGLLASRSVIVAEAGSASTIVIELQSADDGAPTLFHETTEVFVGKGARLRLVFVQALGKGAVHAPVVRSRVERDGALETVTVALGGALVKSLQVTELAEPGASTKVLGIVFGSGRQHFDHHTFQDHVAEHTTSDLDYRTVVGERARSAYTGRLRISKDGGRSEAHQKNHNLVLSDQARADTIPELEILTNDVSCSHAAAVAPIDEEQVFFCTSRGLPPAEARRAIVLGFLEPTVERIPGDQLLTRVRDALEKRLGSFS